MPVFEFLEPVVVELKLQNISATPQVVDENILTTLDGITIALKRQGSPARQFLPFAQYCMKSAAKVLQPKEAMYASVYVTAGLNGVDVSEPGRYLLQAAMHTTQGDIVSKPFTLRVATPRGWKKKSSRRTSSPIKSAGCLRSTAAACFLRPTRCFATSSSGCPIAAWPRHARIPLGLAVAEPAKVLTIGAGAQRGAATTKKAFKVDGAQPQRAESELKAALMNHPMSRPSRSGTWTIRCMWMI